MAEIKGFNAIRAASVSLVVLSHVGIVEAATNPLAVRFFSVFNASFGVRAFFVLSGFLITTLLLTEHQKAGRIHVLNFMARRALRILPLYFLVLLSLAPYFWAGRFWEPMETVAYAIFFVYNFIPNELNVHYLSHLWSLGVEEQFYLLWPLVISILAIRRNLLLSLCASLIVLCWWRMVDGYGAELMTHAPNRWTIPAMYPIIMGAALAILVRHPTVGEVAKTALASKWSVGLGGALICLPLAATGLPVEVEMLGAAGISLAIAWIYLNQHRPAVRSLDWGPIGYLGMISYGIYMWQGVLTGNGPYRQLTYWPPDPWVGALLTLPAAMISYHVMERPILSLKRLFPSAPH